MLTLRHEVGLVLEEHVLPRSIVSVKVTAVAHQENQCDDPQHGQDPTCDDDPSHSNQGSLGSFWGSDSGEESHP